MSNNELLSIDEQTLANIMNKRHRSTKSQFKNPPQPKFCIKEKSLDGREIYINILSYSRIAAQLSEFDPIPLYGGMEIRSYGSNKNAAFTKHTPPQLIFAVMASPEVLKKTGRNSADTPEQMNLVELMCEFVEAMNPGIVLSKKPEILKDKDLAGELKDVWSAVQNFRDKEKAGVSDIVVYTEFGPESASEVLVKTTQSTEVKNDTTMESETYEARKLDQTSESHFYTKSREHEAETEKSEVVPLSKKSFSDLEQQNIDIEKMSLDDIKVASKKQENHLSNDSNEKNIKMQNQKNKESHFLPKFLSSNKEKEAKDKEKDKDKQQDDQEPKTKTKKSLNFFRRSKSSSSPTHTSFKNSDLVEH